MCGSCGNNGCGCPSPIIASINSTNNSKGRDGLDAYQLAVLGGFEGTLQEFNDLNINQSYEEFTW